MMAPRPPSDQLALLALRAQAGDDSKLDRFLARVMATGILAARATMSERNVKKDQPHPATMVSATQARLLDRVIADPAQAERVRFKVARLVGRMLAGVGRLVEQDVADDVTEASIQTLARTEIMRAFNQGQQEEYARRSDVAPALMLVEIRDDRTRGNPKGRYPHGGVHWQMHGFIALTSNPIWESITPPNGYNCRGSIRPVTWAELESHGVVMPDGQTIDTVKLRSKFIAQWKLIDAGEYPDPGFALD